MEKNWHRRFITSRKTDLSENTKLEDKKLLDHLVKGNVITENEKSRLKNDRLGTDYDRASDLYELLPSRVNGYVKMMEALKLTNQEVARGILMEGLRLNDEQAWKRLQLQEEEEQREIFQNTVECSTNLQIIEVPEQPSLEALAADPKIQKLFTKEIYDYLFRGQPLEISFVGNGRSVHDADFPAGSIILPKKSRGSAGILNIVEFDNKQTKERESSLYDVRGLKQMFEKLDYTIFPTNTNVLEGRRKTKEDIMKLIAYFKNKCKDEKPASIFLFIGSHGCYKDGSLIGTSDNKSIRVDDIVEEFHQSKCPPEIAKTPKVLFFQACRNIPRTRSSVPDDGTTSEDAEDFNILLFEATSPGKKAKRNLKKGSWVVFSFISAMKEHIEEKSLQEIMDKTSEMVKELRMINGVPYQEPTISKNTMKPLFFNI